MMNKDLFLEIVNGMIKTLIQEQEINQSFKCGIVGKILFDLEECEAFKSLFRILSVMGFTDEEIQKIHYYANLRAGNIKTKTIDELYNNLIKTRERKLINEISYYPSNDY